jgi:hypothetical protein
MNSTASTLLRSLTKLILRKHRFQLRIMQGWRWGCIDRTLDRVMGKGVNIPIPTISVEVFDTVPAWAVSGRSDQGWPCAYSMLRTSGLVLLDSLAS